VRKTGGQLFANLQRQISAPMCSESGTGTAPDSLLLVHGMVFQLLSALEKSTAGEAN